jgi:hypothetical protein
MTRNPSIPDSIRELVEAYCDDLIDDEQLRQLERGLIDDAEARRMFVREFQLHTELQFAIRSRRAAGAVLDRVQAEVPEGPPPASPSGTLAGRRGWSAARLSASILAVFSLLAILAVTAARWIGRDSVPAAASVRATERRDRNVAWLVNAQDCRWAGAEVQMPGRDMRAGKLLGLLGGLAEIEFECGAQVILQGPAELVLVDGQTARLVHGSLTARVPEQARGFTVLSPQGKVVDLGTEFGLSVDEQGATTVRVFRGVVAAFPLAAGGDANPAVTVSQDQTARIDGLSVDLMNAGQGPAVVKFVRKIQPPPLITPRTLLLDFQLPVPGSIQDAQGHGIGLTHRLPGTGAALPGRDPNLVLSTPDRSLRLTTTRSDLNTQDHMLTGEYLGLRLHDLGFTGSEDFEISTTIPKIPGLKQVGQFGLYVGAGSTACIRGGLISWAMPDRYGLFLVNNHGGVDSDLNELGLMSTGDDLRLTLRRLGGEFSLLVENLSRRSSSTLTIAHPAFLDAESDLFAGLFGANPQTDVSKTLTITELRCTVWTRQRTLPRSTL